MPGVGGDWNGCKVFSATTSGRRETLGEKVTDWISVHPEKRVVHTCVQQSSDCSFHCFSLVLFYKEEQRP